MGNLRWEKQQGDSEYAYSGSRVIGMIGRLYDEPDRWWWNATNAVSMRYIAKGSGELTSKAAAKRAVARAWSKWIAAAGLVPVPSGVTEND